MIYKKYDYDSYQIYTIQTNKFKNCYMEVNFRDDIRDVNASRRNFLTNLMNYTSLKYPTKREMIIAEEELYNLTSGTNCYRLGYNITSYFSMDILHPSYVKEKDYFDNALCFFFDKITKPNVEGKIWNERSFEIIKERLHVAVDQYKENPTAFARVKSREILFNDSITGKNIIGTHDDIDSITMEDICKEYNDMFQNSNCEIVIIGNLDMDEVVKKINKIFYKPSIVKKEIPSVIENPFKPFQQMNVLSKFNQTQLIQYYILPKLSYVERNFVSSLFQKIFGEGNLSDKLGKYLRMENSLCYSYSFQYFWGDCYCTVMTKLKSENVPKATGYIKQALIEMIKGDFTEEELQIQKNKLLSDLKLREDSIYGLIDNYYFHEVYGSALFKDYEKEIVNVSKEDIKVFAKKIQLTFQYVLEEGVNDERD